jgi:ATP-dependent Clp protease ATP-binding subunit ClpA
MKFTIVGAGGATGSLDASNMFKPALAEEINVVTTLDDTDSILKRWCFRKTFSKIIVEPSVEETITILNNINKYEDHHNVITRKH